VLPLMHWNDIGADSTAVAYGDEFIWCKLLLAAPTRCRAAARCFRSH